MKTKLLILFLLIQSVGFTQEMWRPMGNDDFNSPSCGAAKLAGRNPIIVKNDHVFLFNIESPTSPGTAYRFSVGKHNGSQWEHFGFPFVFLSIPTIDCAVGNNEVPYVLFNDINTDNLPHVKKFENGNWTDVGTSISTVSSSLLNIAVGTDNLPQILFLEGNVIKLKKFDGNNWVLLSETTEFFPYTSISLQLDNNNVAYVVTNDQVGSTYNSFVKKFNGSAWEEVGITGFAGEGRSLVFDVSNVPHMLVGNTIKKFSGTTWEDFSNPLSGIYPVGLSQALNLFFNNSNTLYASFLGTRYPPGTTSFYVNKLNNGAWQSVWDGGFMYDKVCTVSGDSVFYVSYYSNNHPSIYKKTGNGQSAVMEGSSIHSTSSYTNYNSPQGEIMSHDFSICNGIPLLAYIGTSNKASVIMYVNNNWTNLGALQISENEINNVLVKSGTDGKIYLAYNNKLSTTLSDTKLTVKQLTATGWQPLGPVNFSLSAGAQFDFKVSHANEPYVLYMSGRLQKFDGTNWVYVGGSAYNGDVAARLALDANDVPYVAREGSIAVKKLNGNVWEFVDQAGLSAYTGTSYRPRIIFDALNNLYLGFTDSTLKVHIKKLNNGLWESVGPDFFTTGNTDQYELAVDHNNVLYVVYNEFEDNFRGKIKVKKFNGTDWEFVGESDFSATTVQVVKLDFLENNTPIVAYSSSTSSNSASININTRFFGASGALSINEPPLVSDNQNWILTPNPVTNTFSIVGKETIQSLEIYTLTGEKVQVENNYSKNIDVSALRSGIYIAKIKTNSGMSAVKLVKN